MTTLLPRSLRTTFRTCAPGIRKHILGEQEHLHHRSGRECVYDAARRRLDLRGCLTHGYASDSLDLLTQAFGGVDEELPMELLYLRRPLGGSRQRDLGRRERAVQGDDQRVPAQNHGHSRGPVAGPLLLEVDRRFRNVLRDVRPGPRHRSTTSLSSTQVPCEEQKKADETRHLQVLSLVGLLRNGPPGCTGLPFI